MNAYGFFAAAGAIATTFWVRLHHRQMGISENQLWAALWLMIAGAVVGAKGLFVALGWHHYASGELRFWADFGAGFVFFGGLLGALFVGGMFAIWQRLSFWRGADYFAVALPLGHAIGRVGCYTQGCCGGHPPHPVQLYESAGLLLIMAATWRVLKSVEAGRTSRGVAFCAYLMLYGILRLALDPLRADGRPERFLGFSHQQGIALGLMLAGAIFWRWRTRVPPMINDAASRSEPSRIS